MTNDEMAEMIAERNGNQRFCKNCDDCCQPYNSTDDCFKSAMQAMEWKDEQFAKEKQQWIEKACKYLFENYHGEKLSLRMIEDFKNYMKGE